jgi:hypothetical protein
MSGQGKDVLILSRDADPEADKIARALELADQEERIKRLEKINKDLQELAKLQQAQIKPNNYPKPGPSGNTIGIVVPKTAINPAPPNDNPETAEEGWWDSFMHGTKDAAQKYKRDMSPSLHEFAGEAMDKGGTIAMAGGAVAEVGGVVAATGVGAGVGGVMVAAGGATAAVGGGVAGVGTISETAATALDKAADWIIEGKAPNLVKPLLELGESLLINRLLKWLPGKGKRSSNSRELGGGGGYVKRNCTLLQNGVPGSGYRGGRHGNIKKGGYSYNPNRESHHMPADSTYDSVNGTPVSSDDKPTIQMDKDDHKQTASYDNKPGASAYRATQKALIKTGKTGYFEAMMMDVADVELKFPGKYEAAIAQMMAWARCMGYI